MNHRKSLWVFSLVFFVMAQVADAAPISETLPKGAIIAFLPEPDSKFYSDVKSLKRWLKSQGWVLCDGTQGTPDLNYQMLIGTTNVRQTWQKVGSRTHSHKIGGESGPSRGRVKAVRGGFGRQERIPGDGHKHPIEFVSDTAEHLPLSTRVLFIMKIK